MNNSPKVAQVTTHLLFSNLTKSFVLLLFFITVSRLLGSVDLGNYSLALAITTPFFAFGLLGARVARVTGPTQLTNESFEIAMIVSGFVATCLSMCFAFFIFPSVSTVVLLVCLYKWSDLFTELYAGSLQLENKTLRLATISAIGALVVASISIGVLILSQSLYFSLCVFAICGWVYALFFRITTTQKRTNVFSLKQIKKVFLLGVPLGISGAVAALGSTLPQYRVAATLGDSEVGNLAIFLYVYALADIFGAAYGQAWIPRIQSLMNFQAQNRFVIKVGFVSSLFTIPLTVAGLLLFSTIGPLIFGTFFTVTFEEAFALICAVVVLPFVHIVATSLFVRVHYKRSMFTMLASTFVTALFAILLIPSQGIAGGIYAVAAGLFTRGIISVAFLIYSKEIQVD